MLCGSRPPAGKARTCPARCYHKASRPDATTTRLAPRETQIGFPSLHRVLDDRDLLDMFPVRVKQCETILDGHDKAPAGAQADRTGRLPAPKKLSLPVAHTRPSPIAA
jgi:hypothetical protein